MPKREIKLTVNIPEGYEIESAPDSSPITEGYNPPGINFNVYIKPACQPVKVKLQPMATAPKDGGWFTILYYGTPRFYSPSARWDKERNVFCRPDGVPLGYEFMRGWFRFEVETGLESL